MTAVAQYDTAAAERRAERIRLRLDSIADGVTAVLPMIREAIEKGDPEALGYRSVGEYVSDRFGGALGRLPVDLRRPVVHELHAAGMSTRAIAPVVGVSREAVRTDLLSGDNNLSPAPTVDRDTGEILDEIPDDVQAAADELGVDLRRREPEPPKVTVGIDGKTYQRPTPIPPTPVSPERQREAELDRGRRDTCRAVSDAIRSLTGGEAQARIFLEHFYPHESRFLVDGERLTADRIQSAIEFLTAIQKEIP